MRKRIYLNDGWGFTEQFTERLLEPDFNPCELTQVRLPHTVRETPLHYFDESVYQMVSGYCKKIFIPGAWRGKRVLLTIAGAAHGSFVFWNGKAAGEHHCGYTSFTLDVTELLSYDAENTLTVKLDSRESQNIPPFGFVIDYMTYGGMYREVWLDVAESAWIADVFVHNEITSINDGKAKLHAEITACGRTDGLKVRVSIREKGTEVFSPLAEGAVCGDKARLEAVMTGVKLWDIENPNCYEVKAELLSGGDALDEQLVTTGLRQTEFRADGFYLNGRKVKLRGLNRHQSYPYVGYAMPESMQKMDADILKRELGVNAVRTSHYPQSGYFYDRCDEIGLLVFTELPGWQHIGDEAWKEQAVRNVEDMVMQYRNHPSVILWGVRINESADDDAFYRRTNEAAHALDPTRPTGGVRMHKKSSLLEDVYTYNDFLHDGKNRGCEKKARVTPDSGKSYLISEYNGHMFPTKACDSEPHRTEHALRHARVLNAVSGEPDIAGSFGWCMTDYNTHKDFGSGDRVCYHGVLDMFRNPKTAAAVYACLQEETPVLALSSSMDIGENPGGNRGEVYIFTNADSVRMYKNGQFVKEYRKEESPFRYLAHGPILIDDFIGDVMLRQENLSPGAERTLRELLNAVARFGLTGLPKMAYVKAAKLILLHRMKPEMAVELYKRYVGDWGGAVTSYRFEAVKDGKTVKTLVKEPMKTVRLSAGADHEKLREERTYDVAAVRILAEDENGNLLPFFGEPVELAAEGPVELIGPHVISLAGGMGGTYIRTVGEPGNALLRIKTAQAAPVELTFTVTV